MPTLRSRLSAALKVLVSGTTGPTTRTGLDSEYHENSLADITTIDNSRVSKYKDYILMDDNYGQLITSVLDTVADSVIRLDEPIDHPIKIMSESEKTVKFIKDLYRFLDIRNKLWSWSRSLSKFGDLFVEVIWALDGSDTNAKLSRIVGLKALPAQTIKLNTIDDRGTIDLKFPYKQEVEGVTVAKFRQWQLVHFMLRREPTDDFGTSWLKASRVPYRQLVAMENALCLARLKKVNLRVHKVDITDKTVDQVPIVINEYKSQFTEKFWLNPSTGKYEIHKTPLFGNSDIFMGVTKDGGRNAGIDILEGKSEVDIKDILYIRENLLGALKVPKHRLNITDIGGSSKLVSNDQGLNFSASIQRVQAALVEGLKFITDLALMVNGINIKTDSKVDYTLGLPKQRTVDELIAARVELIRSTVAKNYKELGLLSDEDILTDVMRLERDRVAKILKQIAKNKQDLDNQTQTPNDSNKDSKSKLDKNFNKTGTPSAPIRKPQKEGLSKVIKDPVIEKIVEDVHQLMRNQRVYNSTRFDLNFIEKELSQKMISPGNNGVDND
jgi:hypothetical protein